jgi:cholest-4-en-3-one 26-monooxygenase
VEENMRQLVIDVLNPDTYRAGDPEQNGLPHDQYDYLREHEPVFKQRTEDPFTVDDIWVLTRYEDVLAVDKDAERFPSPLGITSRVWTPFDTSLGGKPAMVVMNGEEHRRNRRVVSRGFTPHVVKSFERHFRTMAADIVDKAVAKGSFDFVPEIAVEMPLQAICDLLGVPQEDRAKFLGWVNAMAVPTDPNYAPSPEEALAAVNNIWQYGLELAAHRRENPGENIMSKIVDGMSSETLDDEELMGFTLLLAGAGSDTTRNTLSHGLYALLRNPDQMAWLRDHADDVPDTAIQEIVRWASPVIHFCRSPKEDVELHGRHIAAGDRIAILFPAANFDPEAFDDPHSFDLTRNPNPHLAFGRGPHVCLGRHIAAIELKILLEELLQRTSSIELDGEIGYTRDAFLRGVHTLPITVQGA